MTRTGQGSSDGATRSHAATNIAGAKAAKGFRTLAISEIRTSRKCHSVLWKVSLYRTRLTVAAAGSAFGGIHGATKGD